MKIICVYKIGGDFDSDYVVALHESLNKYGDFLCLTDGDVPDYIPQEPLQHRWPGWWSKIEMMGYDNDILYFDLDTVITGDISYMVDWAKKGHDKLVMLSDFYFPENPASGVMYIPNDVGNSIYGIFKDKPDYYMGKFRGDQNFISAVWEDIDRWPDIVGKDYIASYKTHVTKEYPRRLNVLQVDVQKSKIIAFHGKPRIKDVKEFWNVSK